MSESNHVEAEIVHDLPDDIAAGIGRVMVGTSKLEHKLTSLIGLVLQLDKAEVRLAIRQPRIEERLDVILELFSLKGLEPDFDFTEFRKTLIDVGRRRHRLAHGIWLQTPDTGELFLRLARGSWPKDLLPPDNRNSLRRDTFPQSIPYGPSELADDNAAINTALERLDELGELLDHALVAFPDRFREPLAPVNPLGSHNRITPSTQ